MFTPGFSPFAQLLTLASKVMTDGLMVKVMV